MIQRKLVTTIKGKGEGEYEDKSLSAIYPQKNIIATKHDSIINDLTWNSSIKAPNIFSSIEIIISKQRNLERDE